MRALQKIVQQGNSAIVTIPRQLMNSLGWRPGDLVILTSNSDDALHVQLWRDPKSAQGRSPGILPDAPPLVTR